MLMDFQVVLDLHNIMPEQKINCMPARFDSIKHKRRHPMTQNFSDNTLYEMNNLEVLRGRHCILKEMGNIYLHGGIMRFIRLSHRRDILVELDIILVEYSNLVYDEQESERMSGLHIKKIDPSIPISYSVALSICNKLKAKTGIDMLILPDRDWNYHTDTEWTHWNYFRIYAFDTTTSPPSLP